MRYPHATVALALATLLSVTGCGQVSPVSPEPSPPASPATPVVTPTPTPTPSVASPATASPPPTPTPSTPAKDTRKGKQLADPYRVNGIIVVSKKHRITAGYGPQDPTGPYQLEQQAASALTRMTAAATADGVRIRVRSGYRTWATQNAIYQKALANYPQSISFYAPAGASEHQTGLAVDLWDGVTWSLPMANTETGKWLFANAHDYGFILRYPKGKQKITGYHYEPWHYRYIGKKNAQNFTGNKETLEEYLGLA